MKVKQISVFLENRSGRLAQVSQILADNCVNIRALSLADTADFGILRVIVDDAKKASDVLKAAGYTLNETDVVAVEVSDQPGGLAKVLSYLWKAELDVEYMYAFIQGSENSAIMIFRFENTDKAIQVFKESNVRILSGEEVCRL